MLLAIFNIVVNVNCHFIQDNTKEATLRVQVVDALQNKPLKGIKVRIAERYIPNGMSVTDGLLQEGESNAKGEILYHKLRLGKYLISILEAPKAFAIESLPMLILKDKMNEFSISLPPAASLSGKVTLVGPEEFVKQNVTVVATQDKKTQREQGGPVEDDVTVIQFEVQADKEGKYKFERLSAVLPVSVGVRTVGPNSDGMQGKRKKIGSLDPNREKVNIDFTLNSIDTSIVSIKGCVKLNEKPVSLASILVYSLEPIDGCDILCWIAADERGQYKAFDLPPAKYRVEILDVRKNIRMKLRQDYFAEKIKDPPSFLDEDFPKKEIQVSKGETAIVNFDVTIPELSHHK